MRITIETDQRRADLAVVRLEGALEVGVVDRLWQEVSARVETTARHLLFDFSGVTIITSAGIGTLIRLLVRLQSRGGSLAIFGCSGKICEVFDIVMLKGILQISGSEAAARARLDV
ncbi:MAG: STAS domain-containing protein [Thermoanaerobaculales bacterium]|nr:STAS domain-containing protein [Thermoanaerobaculales bacterium]